MNRHIERLLAMRDDDGTGWNLSENDKATISWAVELHEAAASAAQCLLTITPRSAYARRVYDELKSVLTPPPPIG